MPKSPPIHGIGRPPSSAPRVDAPCPSLGPRRSPSELLRCGNEAASPQATVTLPCAGEAPMHRRTRSTSGSLAARGPSASRRAKSLLTAVRMPITYLRGYPVQASHPRLCRWHRCLVDRHRRGWQANNSARSVVENLPNASPPSPPPSMDAAWRARTQERPSAARSPPCEPVCGGDGPSFVGRKAADLAMYVDDGRLEHLLLRVVRGYGLTGAPTVDGTISFRRIDRLRIP